MIYQIDKQHKTLDFLAFFLPLNLASGLELAGKARLMLILSHLPTLDHIKVLDINRMFRKISIRRTVLQSAGVDADFLDCVRIV